MDKIYQMQTAPAADPKAVVQGKNYRFTVLTERMLRMEYDPDGEFPNVATQMAINRKFPVPEYEVFDEADKLQIVTKYFQLVYNKQEFCQTGLQVQMFHNPYLMKLGTWFYGDTDFAEAGNLLGTTTTLDNADGDTFYALDTIDDRHVMGDPAKKVPMGQGLMSRNGFTVIDDSESMWLDEEGWVHPAKKGHKDLYFLVYGHDFLGCLKDFYHLAGKQPLLPRYALGNWWSRFYSYTQQEYLDLMDRFKEEGMPVAVSVLDMGWHLVDIDEKYGKGWTGYTWNRELFPDPEGLLKELHDRGKHVSLNVHPADGVRAHEEMYADMAEALGLDPKTELPIAFNITDPDFLDAYFKYLHHPNEEMGVNFWWMDWQQGSVSLAEGYDPLWMLNHFHFLDNQRGDKRPMAFSRFGGLGSHRYPIGFSGSAFITWKSLDFQPYFTATASNVGYGWYSHDIGGHRNGYRNDELTARWVQFGTFSPIMRLHSSNEVFTGKEPWKFCEDSRRVMMRFLRLRHQLIPYIYTMNAKAHFDDLPLVQPMYYQHPDEPEAFQVPNEYYFGTEMIVHPITSANNPELKAGHARTWIPEGLWYDFFTGVAYKGGRKMDLYRTLDSIPVLVKAGAIVPMQDESEISDRVANPSCMDLRVFCGKSGSFVMYEDDGETMAFEQGESSTTEYELDWVNHRFCIHGAKGSLVLLPEQRSYVIRFYGIRKKDIANVSVNGTDMDYQIKEEVEQNRVTVSLGKISTAGEIIIKLKDDVTLAENPKLESLYQILNRSQIYFALKEQIYKLISEGTDVFKQVSTIQAMPLSDDMKMMIQEILIAN
jgi:alpha-glucosidase (family GH31 glycosyl hydrolase)